MITLIRLMYLMWLLVATRCDTNVTSEDAHARIMEASNAFGFNLYKTLLHKEDNIFMSPLTTFTVLSMIHHGANGQTLEELRQGLQFDAYGISEDETCEGFQKLYSHLNNNVNYTMDFLNAVFLKNDYPKNATEDYITDLKQCYDTDVQEVNFADKQEVVETLNQLVNETTRGQIDEFLKSPLDSLTRLFLLSVVYFKGVWNTTFPKKSSYEGEFFNDGNTPANVTMMRLKNVLVPYMYDPELGLSAVELPYKNIESSMVIVLPLNETGLPLIEESLDLKMFQSILTRMRRYEVDELELPKFRIESDYPELRNQLAELGIKTMFDESRADLSGINKGIEYLFVSKFVHKSKIEVDEEGSIASGASGAAIGTRIGSVRSINFIADHPFLFFIRDIPKDLILFMGRVTKL